MISKVSVIKKTEDKYRLVCVNRCVFISLSEIDKVTRSSNNIHFNVSFKDPTKTILRIRRNILNRLIQDCPRLMVT
jgi:hypothetical protein